MACRSGRIKLLSVSSTTTGAQQWSCCCSSCHRSRRPRNFVAWDLQMFVTLRGAPRPTEVAPKALVCDLNSPSFAEQRIYPSPAIQDQTETAHKRLLQMLEQRVLPALQIRSYFAKTAPCSTWPVFKHAHELECWLKASVQLWQSSSTLESALGVGATGPAGVGATDPAGVGATDPDTDAAVQADGLLHKLRQLETGVDEALASELQSVQEAMGNITDYMQNVERWLVAVRKLDSHKAAEWVQTTTDKLEECRSWSAAATITSLELELDREFHKAVGFVDQLTSAASAKEAMSSRFQDLNELRA